MNSADILKDYQKRSINFQIVNSRTALHLGMGMGKTIITLMSIKELLKQKYLNKVLVIAPLRVIQLVWYQEAIKWAETKDMTFSYVLGNKVNRLSALTKDADIYLMNYENLAWLNEIVQKYYIRYDKPFPINGIVFDEIDKMKNSTSNRSRHFKAMSSQFKWRTGLTGTPASNGYQDLFGQYLALDDGVSLGTSKKQYYDRFFKRNRYNGVSGTLFGSKDIIRDLIQPITLTLRTEDYIDMPEFMTNDVYVELSEKVMEIYNSIEFLALAELESGTFVELDHSSSKYTKCVQIASGLMYVDEVIGDEIIRTLEFIHDEKVEALRSIINESGNKSILLIYPFKSNAEHIMSQFRDLNPINFSACNGNNLQNAIDKWVSGECKLMLGHPLSMGHGIDQLKLIDSSIVWYGVTPSLDLYEQTSARLWRQGRKEPVLCHRILAKNTLDEIQVIRLKLKSDEQDELRKLMSEYRAKKGV